MASVIWILGLIAAAACNSQAYRIAGGELTSVDEYPSIVQVEYRLASTHFVQWVQYCGGSIITTRYVVSAAHCFDTEWRPDERRVRAGSSHRGLGGVGVLINQVFNHPNYDPQELDADISLLQLVSSLTYSDVIQPVAVIAPNFELPDGLPVTLAGWGSEESGGPVSPGLRDATVFTINRGLCSSQYSTVSIAPEVTDNMLCVGVPEIGGRAACDQDSGGPLYYDNILVGIISWGLGCGNDTFPTVTTNVAQFTEWIVQTAV